MSFFNFLSQLPGSGYKCRAELECNPLGLNTHIEAWTKWLTLCRQQFRCILAWTKWLIFCWQHRNKYYTVFSSMKHLCFELNDWSLFSKLQLDNKSVMFKVMAWYWSDNKPLPESLMTQFTDTWSWWSCQPTFINKDHCDWSNYC